MTRVQIKNKVQDYLDHADERILKMVYALLKEYQKTPDSESLMTDAQKVEIDRRWKLHKSGKSKSYTIEEMRQHITAKL